MILIMNVMLLVMSFCGLLLEQLSWVIQWYVLGMFFLVFFVGLLVDCIGNCCVVLFGVFLFVVSVGIVLDGQLVMYFLFSLLVLGSGWNLMFIVGIILFGEGYVESECGVV